jgi:hypothetical protein
MKEQMEKNLENIDMQANSENKSKTKPSHERTATCENFS